MHLDRPSFGGNHDIDTHPTGENTSDGVDGHIEFIGGWNDIGAKSAMAVNRLV